MIVEPRADIAGAAQQEFEAAVRAVGRDPADRWMGGYVAYEWRHLRPALASYKLQLGGSRVLEFGCNVGASAVVMAALGAQVTAVDIAPHTLRIARSNMARHGLFARFDLVEDTRQLPYANASFDLILANSVLEYVPPALLTSIFQELHRVAAPDARMYICGTASRLAPREIHSGRWFVNYLPRVLDPVLFGRTEVQRGLSPWLLHGAIKGRFHDISKGHWLESRRAIHGRVTPPILAVAGLANLLGFSPGWLAPNIELLLLRV